MNIQITSLISKLYELNEFLLFGSYFQGDIERVIKNKYLSRRPLNVDPGSPGVHVHLLGTTVLNHLFVWYLLPFIFLEIEIISRKSYWKLQYFNCLCDHLYIIKYLQSTLHKQIQNTIESSIVILSTPESYTRIIWICKKKKCMSPLVTRL